MYRRSLKNYVMKSKRFTNESLFFNKILPVELLGLATLFIMILGVGSAFAAIDFSVWELQEPSGSGTSPTVISSSQLVAGYSDSYFYVGTDGCQTYMDTQTGITTSGSLHPRCEMREMTTGGPAAAWSAADTNKMTVTGKVLMLGSGSSGKTTVSQVFDNTGGFPLCELQYV